MPVKLRLVGRTREYRTIVGSVEKKSRTLRSTVPEVIAALLEVEEGSVLVWSVSPRLKVEVHGERGRGRPKKRRLPT